MVDIDDAATGWDAIDAALNQLYPGVEPKHYGTILKWRLGGPDPLDGISVYPRADHWHFISYGMSELYSKESENADESGWGFEFTFRVARTPADTDPPVWAANFLQNLARYVFGSGNPFAPGHHLNLNGPICLEQPDTSIAAIAFAEDPELSAIDTPHGQLQFLQIVGLTLEEYSAIERWDAQRLLAAMAPSLPLLITDLARGDLTDQPAIAAAIEQGVRREGSSTDALFVQEAGWRVEKAGWARKKTTTVTFGASVAERISRVLQARLPFGRDVHLQAEDSSVAFRPGGQLAISDVGDGRLEIQIPAAVLAELTGVLQPVAGTYPLASAPELAIQIAKSQIRDPDGAVVAEIG